MKVLKGLIFILLLSFPALIYYQLNRKEEVKLSFEVKRGQGLKDVIEELSKEGVIGEPLLLYYYARLKGLKVKSGCYRIEGELSPIEVLRELQKGSPCLKEFTILPGSNLFEVDEILFKKGFCERGEILELSKDVSFLKELKVPSLEGFLYPDTYLVNRDSSCKDVVKVVIRRFHRVFDPLFDSYNPPKLVKVALKEVTPLKIVTVASIVEKETGLKEERPLVAAVIYNRMIRGMKLQCDPTVLYALRLKGVVKDRLLYKDLKVDSPYNTYLYKGLPPTPICNPSLASIKSALYPADVKYLYFVANGKGGHSFSESYNQHLKEVRKFRRWQRGL